MMRFRKSGVSALISLSLVLVLVISVVSIEAKKKRKFDGDFEFADEEDTKNSRKEGKKTWILDPGSDLCQALKCKKKELCLLEDEFTAVCVSKKELHKNGDVIVPKSKLKETTKLDDESSKEYDEDEEDDSDYYDEDEDSNEDLFSSNSNSNKNKNNNNINKVEKSSLLSSSSNSLFPSSGGLIPSTASDSSFKSCTPCPVVKPTFLCGSDNRTYSSLCRLDYHNCIQNSQVTVSCKGFCPCKELEGVSKKKASEAERVSRFMQKYKKTVANLKLQQQQKLSGGKSKSSSLSTNKNQIGFGSQDDNGVFSNNDFASGTPVAPAAPTPKDRYTKYKDYYGFKNAKFGMDKQRSHNEVVNSKPVVNRDCNEEALESMGNRLLDWFSVVMADTQKRKLNRRNRNSQVHFPGDCKREVEWMFAHLNSDEDGQLSLQELYDLENDRNEKCIKPFLDRCDSDKDIFISPREWCSCFAKSDRPCRGANCGSFSDRDDNELDDDDDTDIEGSSDGPLEI